MIERFSLERVHSAGAQFDYEKAKWYNQDWIKILDNATLALRLKAFDPEHYLGIENELLAKVVGLVKERCHLLTDFWAQAAFFFESPASIELEAIAPKWSAQKSLFFNELLLNWQLTQIWDAADLEHAFKEIAAVNGLKPGELMLPLRIMLVGGKYGPGVFDIAGVIGKDATLSRIKSVLEILEKA